MAAMPLSEAPFLEPPTSLRRNFQFRAISMPAYATREEFKVLQDEVEGEKRVTRYILKATRANSKRLDSVEQRLDRVELKLDSLDRRFSAFVREFPATVAGIMRQVLRERDEKSNPAT
jgi:hypothetical protein